MPLRGIINALASYSIGTVNSGRDPGASSRDAGIFNTNSVGIPPIKIQRLARSDFQTSRVYAEQGPLTVLTRNTRRIQTEAETSAMVSVTSEESNTSADDSASAATASSPKNKRSLGRGSRVKIGAISSTKAEKHEWLLVLHEELLRDNSNDKVTAGTDHNHALCIMREQATTSTTASTAEEILPNSLTASSITNFIANASFPVIAGTGARSSTGERFVQIMTRLNAHLQVFQELSKTCAFVLNELSLRPLCESVAHHAHWSPLHVAAYHGWLEVTRSPQLLQFLNQPAVSSRSRAGFNGRCEVPLMLAVLQAHVEVVQALLEAGARLDVTDADGDTVYHYAVRSQQPVMIEIVAGAVSRQHSDLVFNLVNWPNVHGQTPLYAAAHGKRCNKSRAICEALFRAGASSTNNIITNSGSHSHSSVVELGQLICKMFPDWLDVNAARNGGCVYHWARSRDAVLRFIDLGIPLDDAEQRSDNSVPLCVNDFGETPLFCAVKTHRLDVCITLLSNGAAVNVRDRDGLTPLHVAVGCTTRNSGGSHNTVRCLIAFGADVSLKAVVEGAVGGNGKTAVDMARLIESEHARNEILLIMSIGKNAHKCAHFDDAELFVDKIRIEDMPGHSSNDMHLEYNYIEQLMEKFKCGTSPAALKNSRSGTTLLPTATTKQTHSPKTLSVVNNVASKLRGKLRGVAPQPPGSNKALCNNSSFSEIKIDPRSSQSSFHDDNLDVRMETVLSLDGGGIKGINHVLFLMELEERVGVSAVELFDWIAGTSTGGILAIMLAKGLTLRQCLMSYLQVKDRVFRGKRPYSAAALELVLEEKIGHDTLMSELPRPKLLIPACVADRHPPGVHFFSNLTNWTAYEQLVPRAETKKGRLNTLRQQLPPEQQIAWKAARSTGAAPTYFNSFEAYVDGGLVANNPTLDALAEILEYNHIQLTAGSAVLSSISAEILNTVKDSQLKKNDDAARKPHTRRAADEQVTPPLLPDGVPTLKKRQQIDSAEEIKLCCVVSLGCGKGPVAALDGAIDLCRPETLWDVNSLATLAGNMNTMTRMVIEQATSTDGRQVSRARAWCRSLKVPYYRFTPRLSQHIALDCTEDERLVQMMWETRVYLKKQHKNIDQLARLLLTARLNVRN